MRIIMDLTLYDYILKILIIGDSGTGKSALSSRFYDRSFTDFYSSTIGIDFRVKTILLDNIRIKLQIWDTSGNDRFKSITSVYYKNSDGFVILYDVSDPLSFSNVTKWMDYIYKYVKPQYSISHEEFKKHIILVGNKIDLNQPARVRYNEGKDLADRLGIHFLEASVKQNINVKEIFETLTQNIRDSYPPANIMTDNSSSSNLLNNTQINRKKRRLICC